MLRSHNGSLFVIDFQESYVLEGNELEKEGRKEETYLDSVLDDS